jgi:Zn-dependent protease with chaperone function
MVLACALSTRDVDAQLLFPKRSPNSDTTVRIFPKYVSKYDLMTDVDLLHCRYLGSLTEGNRVEDWPVVGKLASLGVRAFNAKTVADMLNQRFPIRDQAAFADIQKTVDECAGILEIDAPHVFIDPTAELNAYVTGVKAPYYMVINQRLYSLYKDKPEEFRFIVGHELGHLKCNHIRAHVVAHVFLNAILGDDAEHGFKEKYIAPFLVYELLYWHRASELSCDRAGLLCVGASDKNPEHAQKVAEQALTRLLHGTHNDVDVDKYLEVVTDFEVNEPFVAVIRKLQGISKTHPFVPERLRQLRQWAQRGNYKTLLTRVAEKPVQRKLVIRSISIKGLPDTDYGFGKSTKCDPIVVASYADREYKSGAFTNDSNPSLGNLAWEFDFTENGRLILEVLDYDTTTGNELVGAGLLQFAVNESKTEGELRLDVQQQSTEVNLPAIEVSYEVK